MAIPLPLITDARDLLLDANNDIVITDDLQFVSGLAAIAQECRIAMLMFQGEWFLDLDAGIPYWEQILGQKPDVAIRAVGIAFRSALLEIEGVIDVPVLDIKFDSTTRKLNVTWQVSTAFGDTEPDTIAAKTPGGAP